MRGERKFQRLSNGKAGEAEAGRRRGAFSGKIQTKAGHARFPPKCVAFRGEPLLLRKTHKRKAPDKAAKEHSFWREREEIAQANSKLNTQKRRAVIRYNTLLYLAVGVVLPYAYYTCIFFGRDLSRP